MSNRYKKVHPAQFVSITFLCPNWKKNVTVENWGDILIGGGCATDFYPADHAIEVDCECGNIHEMVREV